MYKCPHCDVEVFDIAEHLYAAHGYSYGEAVREADYQHQSANEEQPSKWVRGEL